MSQDIYVTRPVLPPFEEYVDYLRDVWDTHNLTNLGKYTKDFIIALKEYMDVDYCLTLCNGHMALEMVLQAMNLSGEVITTPFTFASTTHAIVRNGLTPVFCDIRESDCTIDVDKIESLITDDNKRCLVAVSDGKIAAYVGAESVLDESNIGNIVTHKDYRGKGIGTVLFKAMLDELKASGIVKVFLEVEHDNVPALRLYEKLNFVKYGHRRDYYGAGKDAVLMSLDLD